MASLLCNLHFWTLKALSPGSAAGSDIGTHVYHEKIATSINEGLSISRKVWAQERGITWVPRNKKPERLRDTLRESEELLSTHQPIAMKWKSIRHCLVFLNNGTLITYTVSKHSGDVERIFLDKSLISRLGSKVDNALMVESSIVLTTAMDSQLVHVGLTRKKGSSSSSTHNPLTLTHSDSGRRLEKLSAQDVKISNVGIEGLPTSQVQRHLISNCKEDLVVLWWTDTQEGGWTWSSMAHGGTDNLLVFTLLGGKLRYCCGVQTEYDPISMVFSKCRGHILYSLERTRSTEYTPFTYEFADKKLSKVSTGTAITSDSNVLVSERNQNESILLLGCEDGSLILYDSSATQGKQKKTKAIFSPISLIKWHPAGALVIVCSPTGEIQCYDIGLNPIWFQVLSENPDFSSLLHMGGYFVAPVYLEGAEWGSEPVEEGHGGCYDNFMMLFSNGPMVLLRIELGVLSMGNLGPLEIVSEYIRLNLMDEAISILEQLNWNYQQNECFSCMTIILNHLLIQPLSSQTEGQIESVLDTFLCPESTTSISSIVLNRYKSFVVHLQRRFFHLLYRYGRLEKAYEIAMKIQAKDLFMDVHFLALGLKELDIAESARQRAEDLLTTEPGEGMMCLSEPQDSQCPSSRPPQQGTLTDTDNDIKSSLTTVSIISFDSLASSSSPLAERAIIFESDHSATPSHSEVEDCSDEGTQVATQDTTQEATQEGP